MAACYTNFELNTPQPSPRTTVPHKDYSRPLHVDCSVEYELPSQAKPPPGGRNEPLLMIHPCYFRKMESQRRSPFINNLPTRGASTSRRTSARVMLQQQQQAASVSSVQRHQQNVVQQAAVRQSLQQQQNQVVQAQVQAQVQQTVASTIVQHQQQYTTTAMAPQYQATVRQQQQQTNHNHSHNHSHHHHHHHNQQHQQQQQQTTIPQQQQQQTNISQQQTNIPQQQTNISQQQQTNIPQQQTNIPQQQWEPLVPTNVPSHHYSKPVSVSVGKRDPMLSGCGLYTNTTTDGGLWTDSNHSPLAGERFPDPVVHQEKNLLTGKYRQYLRAHRLHPYMSMAATAFPQLAQMQQISCYNV